MNTEWCVGEGRPSWHQQRAGGAYAAITVGFASKEEATAFAQRCRLYRPHEPATVFKRQTED